MQHQKELIPGKLYRVTKLPGGYIFAIIKRSGGYSENLALLDTGEVLLFLYGKNPANGENQTGWSWKYTEKLVFLYEDKIVEINNVHNVKAYLELVQ